MTFDPTNVEAYTSGRERAEFLSPKHFLVPLTKAICYNLPDKLKIIIMKEEKDDKYIAKL
jgi:hypothetical protein